MATFLIALNKDTYDSDSANAAITDVGAKILKQYACGMMFLVSGTAKQIKSIPGLDIYEKYAADSNVRLQVLGDRAHLDYTIDPTGATQYDGKFTGRGISVYLVDTGISKTHDEFSESNIVDLYSNFGTDFDDVSGHGTAVGSLIVGKDLSGGPDATLLNVKLFNEDVGKITVGEIVEAFDAILIHHNQSQHQVKVVCCAWVTDQHPFIDAMVTEMDISNLVVVCAAGNDGEDVNTKSPAGVDRAITVGSFNRNMQVTAFTNNVFSNGSDGMVNYGAQLDIFALGKDVSVADFQNNSQYLTLSGTSLSAGITSGIVTHYIEQNPTKTAAEIKEILVAEGSIWGQQYLVFDAADPSVDYSSVNKSIVTTENQDALKLTKTPSGRILSVKKGVTASVNVGLNPEATDVSVLDFAPPPAWITFDTSTGIVDVDSSNLDNSVAVPGIYLFAIRGTVRGETLVEEFSIGVYENEESELAPASSFYYDADLDEYDELINYQVAPTVKY